MNSDQYKKSRPVGKRGPKRNAILPAGAIPTRVEIGQVNLDGKIIETEILYPAKLLSGLSQHQRNEICADAGVSFLSEDDWLGIEEALEELALRAKVATEGVSFEKIEKKIEEFKRLAKKLHHMLLDSDEGKIAGGTISWFLATRIKNGLGRDTAHSVMSEIVWATERARASMEDQKSDCKEALSSFALFVAKVEQIFSAKGVVVSAPKPKAYSLGPRPSQFQKFLRALLLAKPNADPSINCSETYVPALMSRISEALKEWRRVAKPQD